MLRTHTCGQLTEKDAGKKATLNGWAHNCRNLGGLIFVDLRDRYGITQIVFDPKQDKNVHNTAETLHKEDVICVSGKVRARPDPNPHLATGKIEVLADKIEVLNRAEPLPIEITDETTASEDTRLKYRFLDLRRPVMQKNLILRHKITKAVHDYFDSLGFLEIETPILAKSTPEGARDYLVPSRVHPGKFFALPQSPQLFKQLLMVSGFDRYVQIARCFRDEDLRADRQPEFTQIDIEMSFIEVDDIIKVVEGLMKNIFAAANIKVKPPFKRITYQEAMDKYGSDKPDTRFGLELIDATECFKDTKFSIFSDVVKAGGKIKCINASKCAKFSRKEIDELEAVVKSQNAKGLVYLKMLDKLDGPIVKFLSDKEQKDIIAKTKVKKDDLLLFVADKKHYIADVSMGVLRLHLGKKLNFIDNKKLNFLWVVDFPLLEYDEENKRHVAIHHPFTSPKDEDIALLDKHPTHVRAKAYDIALNGVEIGGGSIRIHRRDVQEKIFKILGLDENEAKLKFGFLLDAFRYGAPPHGGIALGLDRICAMLSSQESIREVIAFPKNKSAVSLMDNCPSEVNDEQLKELNIKLDLKK